MQEAKSKVLFPHVVVHMLLVLKKLCLRYKKILQKVHPLQIFSRDASLTFSLLTETLAFANSLEPEQKVNPDLDLISV